MNELKSFGININSNLELLNYVDGEFAKSLNSETLENFQPSTGLPYSVLPKSDAMDAVFAIKSSKKAFERWNVLPAQDRSEWLTKIADGLQNHFDDLALAESIDTGIPLRLTRNTSVPKAIEDLKYYASTMLNWSSKADTEKQVARHSLPQPLGVFALITSASRPLNDLISKLAPCIATGNVAICKPSEKTPLTAFLVAQILKEIQLPKGVCNILFGTGTDVGETLTMHPGVAGVSLTGNSLTGKKVVETAAPSFKKLNLDLSSKNSAIVLKDCDLQKAVETCIQSCFSYQGLSGFNTERLFIQDAIYDDFKKLFLDELQKLSLGDPQNEKTFLGPMISKDQVDRVLKSVELAKKEKAKILHGGQIKASLKGFYIEPTVMEDLSDCSELQQDEIFGPIVSLRPFKYAHEAVKWANTTPYGLCATLFTQDITKVHKLVGNLNVGTVWINSWFKVDSQAAIGGTKSSGHSLTGGEKSLEFFTDTKTIYFEI